MARGMAGRGAGAGDGKGAPERVVAAEAAKVRPPGKAMLAAAGDTAALVEVVLRNGRVLRFGAAAEVAAIARLAAALET